jgi:2-polyprenyl-3-methyl-5-hydroxy-6-metoxy-1,4-benzoquinol methylase
VSLRYVDKSHDQWSSHARIQALVQQMPAGSQILDIGAATGMLAQACHGQGYHFDGIEPNPDWAQQAKPFYRHMLCSTLDGTPDLYLAGHDLVVCGDVLEHLADPWSALTRLVTLQAEGARFLISVPNVANIWVRLQLLGGRFEYSQRGILDQTHLRFFTRHSFQALLAQAGLEIRALQVTPIPLLLVHPSFASPSGRVAMRLLNALSQRWPTVLGFQLLADSYRKPASQAYSGGT